METEKFAEPRLSWAVPGASVGAAEERISPRVAPERVEKRGAGDNVEELDLTRRTLRSERDRYQWIGEEKIVGGEAKAEMSRSSLFR